MDTIIDIAERGTDLRLTNGNIIVWKPGGTSLTVPICDIAAVIISECAVSFSAALLAELSLNGILVVLCGRGHSPVGILQPFDLKADQTRVMLGQISASMPIKKRLWQAIVRRKLLHQASVVEYHGKYGGRIRELAAATRSGDVDNLEGQGARIYWRMLDVFSERDRMADDANRLFNYAYAVLLAIIGRSICATGLHPAFGLHHASGHNPFCLASDLIEPFRAVADVAVLDWLATKPENTEVTSSAKRSIVTKIMSAQMTVDGKMVGIIDAVVTSAVSLRDSLLNAKNVLILPEFDPEVALCG